MTTQEPQDAPIIDSQHFCRFPASPSLSFKYKNLPLACFLRFLLNSNKRSSLLQHLAARRDEESEAPRRTVTESWRKAGSARLRYATLPAQANTTGWIQLQAWRSTSANRIACDDRTPQLLRACSSTRVPAQPNSIPTAAALQR